jgi:hypothetical protein
MTSGHVIGHIASNDLAPTRKKPEKKEPSFSKVAYLAGLPPAVRQRIESAYQEHRLGHGVPIPRDTRPDGSSRRGLYPEFVYRLLEASFAVEDELEHASRQNLAVVTELRRRRNAWLDAIGENEVARA